VSQGLTPVTAGDMKHPFASGGLKFSDVWTEGLGLRRTDLCDKTPPRLETDNLTCEKGTSRPQKYYKEVTIWRRITHENVPNTKGNAPGLFESRTVPRRTDNDNMLDYVRTRKQIEHSGLVG